MSSPLSPPANIRRGALTSANWRGCEGALGFPISVLPLRTYVAPAAPGWMRSAAAEIALAPPGVRPLRELRSRQRSQGGYSRPPRRNAQAFDAICKRVNVAECRCYRASGPVHPCWDQAVPSCSPLTGWALGPVAASRPSGPAAASSYLSEGGRVLAGSADWPSTSEAPSCGARPRG
jgi:hypothetical protein